VAEIAVNAYKRTQRGISAAVTRRLRIDTFMVIVKRCLRRQCSRPVLVAVTRNLAREILSAATNAECQRCKASYEIRLAESGRDVELVAIVDSPAISQI
jgi:hypothetical protein